MQLRDRARDSAHAYSVDTSRSCYPRLWPVSCVWVLQLLCAASSSFARTWTATASQLGRKPTANSGSWLHRARSAIFPNLHRSRAPAAKSSHASLDRSSHILCCHAFCVDGLPRRCVLQCSSRGDQCHQCAPFASGHDCAGGGRCWRGRRGMALGLLCRTALPQACARARSGGAWQPNGLFTIAFTAAGRGRRPHAACAVGARVER